MVSLRRIGVALAICIFWSLVGTAQTLTVTNNLKVWLKADSLGLANGTPVDFWTDSSGNTNHATQITTSNRPTFVANAINTRPALLFDGTTDFLMLTNVPDNVYGPRLPLTGGLTLIAVFRTFSTDTTRSYTGNAPQTLIGDNTGATYMEFGLNGGKGEFNRYVAGWNYVDGATSLNNTNGVPAHYLIATHRTSDGLAKLYADGNLEATTNLAYQTTFTGISRISGGYINGVGTGDLFDGLIAEVLVYGSALSDADRLSVQEYLNFKYAIPEPTVGALTAVGLLVALRQRRRA